MRIKESNEVKVKVKMEENYGNGFNEGFELFRAYV